MAAIIFDLDGTLIDSAPDIQAAVNRTLADLGRPALGLETVKSYIGHGVANLLSQVAQTSGLTIAPNDLHRHFMTHYHAGESRPYPGVLTALEVLLKADLHLGICTNKPDLPTREVLAHLGLTPVFKAVISGDSLAMRKPDPAPLLAAAAALGQDQVIFVGDSEVDAETARAAGIPFVLYTGGYRKSPVTDIPHHAAFDDHAALPQLIEALLHP